VKPGIVTTIMSLALAVLAACGGADTSERAGTASSGLTSVATTPVPFDHTNKKSTWAGTASQLMFADALASCAYDTSVDVVVAPEFAMSAIRYYADEYVQRTHGWMGDAICHYANPDPNEPEINYANIGSTPEERWRLQRNDTHCNADPGNQTPASVNLERTTAPIETPSGTPFIGVGESATAATARRALEIPTMNLCIAQNLRLRSPGASAGTALLLSGADQRQILVLIKERAQIAMLQLALLGKVFATAEVADPGAVSNISLVDNPTMYYGYPYSYIAMLQYWARHAESESRLKLIRGMGDDLATAVQLHVAVSRELAELLARSSSAHLARGASPADPVWNAGGVRNLQAVDTWGPASWRERTIASLFGGDPIVEDPVENTTPWQHFRGTVNSPAGHEFGYLGWPDPGDAPFASVEAKDPRIGQLFGLASSANVVYLAVISGLFQPQPRSVYHCNPTNRETSASRLYRAVEAFLRTRDCTAYQSGTNTCPTVSLGDVSTNLSDYSTFELWKRFRINPAHAEQVVAQLDELTPRVCKKSYFADDYGQPSFEPGTFTKRGALDFSGEISLAPNLDGDGVDYLHLVGYQPRQRSIREDAGLYTRYSGYSMPEVIEPTADPSTQGFETGQSPEEGPVDVDRNALEQMRVMGAVPALVATRQAVGSATAALESQPAPVKSYFAHATKILGLIDGAVGVATATRLFSQTHLVDDNRASRGGATLHRKIVVGASEVLVGGEYLAPRRALVSVDSSDPFWTTDTTQLRLYAVANDPLMANLAVQGGASVFGRTAANVLVDSPSAGSGVYVGGAPVQGSGSLEFDFAVPETESDDRATKWTLIVRKAGSPPEYRPLAANITLVGARSQYFAFQGVLPGMASNIIAVDPSQPSIPAFDGFGLPPRWLPPADPGLLGTSAGDDGVASYLGKAKQSAEQATIAVKEAFDRMLEQQQDQSALAAAVVNGKTVGDLETSALCGSSNCDAPVKSQIIGIPNIWDDAPIRYTMIRGLNDIQHQTRTRTPWLTLKENCTPQTNQSYAEMLAQQEPHQRLDCLGYAILLNGAGTFSILKSVDDLRDAPNLPSFSEYAGGELYRVAIEQWNGYRTVKEVARSVVAAVDEAGAYAELAQQELFNANSQWLDMKARCEDFAPVIPLCSEEQSEWGSPAGLSGGSFERICGTSPKFEEAGWWVDSYQRPEYLHGGTQVNPEFNRSRDAGPTLGEKRRLCEGYKANLTTSQARLLDAHMQGYANVQARASEFLAAVARFHVAGADAVAVKTKAKLARASADLQVELLRASQKTSSGLYRQVHSYDAWRAQALLENARMSATFARKAIESHYLVDLSALNAPEPLVASPSTWADQVYEYDLDMPAAVGLSVGTATPGGIYPNRILDYVGNLERFVNGFAIARPTSVADSDTEVISLPGPLGTLGIAPLPPAANHLVDGAAYSWTYLCPDGAWRSIPPHLVPKDACKTPEQVAASATGPLPTRARLTFALDPWGRVYGDIANEPFDRRYNARWTQVAVNLVGTGLLDCSKARDQAACYTQPFVRYNMGHRGTPWITNADKAWEFLPMSESSIDGGKALAAEQWLDPLSNAWSKPYVSAVTRSEFVMRPFGGNYEIEFDVTPEFVLERIERVQLLAGARYWVKQK
jgi:hypothetical protein